MSKTKEIIFTFLGLYRFAASSSHTFATDFRLPSHGSFGIESLLKSQPGSPEERNPSLKPNLFFGPIHTESILPF